MQYDWYPYKTGKFGHRTPSEDGSKNQGDASANQGMPTSAHKPLEARKEFQSGPQKEPTLWMP